jgi:hypothetical protein
MCLLHRTVLLEVRAYVKSKQFYDRHYIAVKVKCLISKALRHEGMSGKGCIDPHFLDLCTSQRWVVSFTPQPLYPRGKAPGTHWIGGWVGPRAGLDDVGRENSWPYRDSNSDLTVVQPVASRYRSMYLFNFGGVFQVKGQIFLLWEYCNELLAARIWKGVMFHYFFRLSIRI